MRRLTRSRGTKPRRAPRRARRLWTRRRLQWACAAVALALAVGAPMWWWQSGRAARTAAAWQARALAATTGMGLTADRVLVVGRAETPRAEVREAVGLERDAPILAFDPAAAKARLERLSWVRAAAVERRFPDTVLVRLVEREPLALWQNDGELALIDRHGVVIERGGLDRFAHLLLVVGDGAPEHAGALVAIMKSEPDLAPRVSAAVRVAERRWNLRLENGVDVRLPEDGAAAAWHRLAELEREHGLLERDVLAVDLRLPDRLVVRMSPEAARRAREPGRDT